MEDKNMNNVLVKTNFKKMAFTKTKPIKRDDIFEIKSDMMGGIYVNDKEIELRRDRFFCSDGKVLTKIYQNNRLCMIQMAK
jgi:hypothetical protein